MLLKSAMSEKNTVSVRRSAWSAPLPMSWLMSRGSTNLPNVSLMRSRERNSSTMRLNEVASSPTSSRVRMTTGAEFVAGRDGAGAGHELAQTSHRLSRTHSADAEADAAGARTGQS